LFLGRKMQHGTLVHANVPWRGSRFSKCRCERSFCGENVPNKHTDTYMSVV
jgi:hypothetical protein